MHFEQAGKLFKEAGQQDKAKEAYLKYANSSDKLDSRGAAADGFTQAAFLEKDFKAQIQLLKMAEQQYLIDGQGDRALTNFKDLAKTQLETYENNLEDGYNDKESFQSLTQLFKALHDKVYQTEDNYVFNSDLIDMYMNMLVKYNMLHEAIQARMQFIRYLHKNGTVDHQARRAYVEVISLHVLANETFKITQILQEMAQADPACFGRDEYNLGQGMLDLVGQEGMSSVQDQDWKGMQNLLKKPLFKFLNNEIVKKLKLLCIDKIEEQESGVAASGPGATGVPEAGAAKNLMDDNEFA